MGAVRRPVWHLALAAVLGAALGSASMATYLYVYQLRVQENTQQIEKQEKRIERLEKKPQPILRKPTYEPPRKWWRFWER